MVDSECSIIKLQFNINLFLDDNSPFIIPIHLVIKAMIRSLRNDAKSSFVTTRSGVL